jgi:hypothetical protein
VSRDRQRRSGRVLRFGLASLGALTSSVAEELKDSNLMQWFARCGGPLVIDLRLVRTTLSVPFNVEIWCCPANGSCLYTSSLRPVGLKSNGGRARTCRAMPSIPSWDPSYDSVM